MITLTVVRGAALLVCAAASATFASTPEWGEGDASGAVVFMTDDRFDGYRGSSSTGFLAFFYAPWCGHCKKAKPEFAKASLQTSVPLVALDCTSTASAVCEKHGVSSYPTLKFFPAVAAEPPDAPRPEPVAYSGARSSSGFLKYLEKMDPSYTPPPFDPEFVPDAWNSTEGIVVHLSDEHWDSYFSTISPEGKAVAMFYAPWCGHCRNAKPGFAEASVLFRRSMPFVAVDCTDGGAATCAKYGVESYPQFKYVSPKEQDNDPNKAETVADGAGRSSGDFISFVEKKLDAANAGLLKASCQAVAEAPQNERREMPRLHRKEALCGQSQEEHAPSAAPEVQN